MSFIKTTSLVLVGLWASLSTASGPSVVDNAFIVESMPGNNVAGQDNFLKDVADQVSKLGTSCQATLRRTFDSPHFTGASFDLKCSDSVAQHHVLSAIRKTTGVGKVWPVGLVKHQMALPGHDVQAWHAHSKRGNESDLLEENDRQGGRQSSVDGFSTHKMCNVDRLHNKGITGAGIKIAVIDTGFDLSVHGLSKTKITYSVDLTGEFKDASDNCSAHGTHVLGIVGAKSSDNQYNVSGVAPDATYELYRIQQCAASGADLDVLIAALIEAAKRGVDIITCSFGGSGTFPEEAWSLAASRVAASGIYVSTPAGNDGPGPFTGGIPATGQLVSATGAADNIVQPCLEWEGSITTHGQTRPFSFVPGGQLNFPDKELKVWSPIPAETNAYPSNCSRIVNEPPKDPANTIAVINLDQCFVDSDGVSLESSTKYNIPYMMYYMSKAPQGKEERCPDWMESSGSLTIGTITTDHAFGAKLVAELGKGNQVSVKIPNNPTAGKVSISNRKSSGGYISYYSSWGPTWDGRTMPTYVAPGNFILSTMPKRLGSWGVEGGTSMATPYAAGVAALMKQQFSNLSSAQIQSILASTAQPIKFNDRKGSSYTGEVKDFFAPILQQGGGLIDAYAASQTKTYLNVTNLSFNDTAHRVHSTTVQISNIGTDKMTYHLHHIGAASGYFLNTTGGAKYNLSGAMGIPTYADLRIEPSTFTLDSGKSATVSVSIASEPNLPGGVAYFGGYVAINATCHGKATDHLTIPYTGFTQNLALIPAIDRDQTYGGPVDPNNGVASPGTDGRVYTCTYNKAARVPSTFSDGLFPGIQVALVTGASRNMTINLINHDTGAATLPNDLAIGSTGVWGKNSFWYWDGTNSHKATVPAGNYFWRVKILRLNGDVADAKAWDVMDTVWWTLKYSTNTSSPSG